MRQVFDHSNVYNCIGASDNRRYVRLVFCESRIRGDIPHLSKSQRVVNDLPLLWSAKGLLKPTVRSRINSSFDKVEN